MFHGNLKSCYVLKLVLFDADLHVVTAVLHNLLNLCLLCFCFLYFIGKLRHRDRCKLDVEFLKKLALVAHGCPEIKRSCGNLKNTDIFECFNYITDSKEIFDSSLEYRVIQSAVCHVCKRNTESS